jgi:hypothetical protein
MSANLLAYVNKMADLFETSTFLSLHTGYMLVCYVAVYKLLR